jgi:threonine dehydrogenase-like Zn-dependent dehydrogenase
MKALVYHGPGRKNWEDVHRFTFDRIDEAYEVFGDAAANSALKVVITPA